MNRFLAALCAVFFLALLIGAWPAVRAQSSPRLQAETLFDEAQRALARGNHDGAASLLKEALTKDPAFTPAIWQLAQIYEANGQLDYARELLARGLRQDPQAAWAREKLAQIDGVRTRELLDEARASMSAGDYGEAIPKLSAYLGLKPDDETALICMAKCHLERGEAQTAKAYLDKARANDPGNAAIAPLASRIAHLSTFEAARREAAASADAAASQSRAVAAQSGETPDAVASGSAGTPGMVVEQSAQASHGSGKRLMERSRRAIDESKGAVLRQGRQAFDGSKGMLAAGASALRAYLVPILLVAVLVAVAIDLRRKIIRRSYPLEGSIGVVPILDVVSLINANLRSGRLIIVHPDARGEVYFEKGEIIHAVCDRLHGKEAFHKLMDIRSGRFFFHNHLPNVRRTVTDPLGLLLLSMKPLEEKSTEQRKEPKRPTVSVPER
jgi:tetratricopeptide (TPR) repeat protein